MCANTLCPLSNSTRNCVFGNASVTAPSTSITSSLAKNLSFLTGYKIMGAAPLPLPPARASQPASRPLLPTGTPVLRKHPGAILRHGDRVLEVGGERAVGGVDRPLVVLVEVYRVVAERDHGLYRERHAGQQLDTGSLLPVVRDLGILVHLAADPVRDEVADHPVALRLGDGLYGVPHVPEPVSGPHGVRGRPQALLRDLQQPARRLGHLADGDRDGRVGDEALVADADVYGEDVAVLQPVGARDAVHDHGVRGGADGARKVRGAGAAGVALERRGAAVGADKVLGHPVEVGGCDGRLRVLGRRVQASGRDLAALPHSRELALALPNDQAPSSPTAARISSVTSEMGFLASTVVSRPRLS